MSDARPYPPWWRERLEDLDDQADLYELAEPSIATYTDVDEPRIDSQWDDREPD